jgi:PAS domain S-box-containing protein
VVEKGFFETQCLFVCDQITLEILDVNEATVQFFGESKAIIKKKYLHELVTEVTGDLADELKVHEKSSTFDKVWRLHSNTKKDRIIQFSTQIINYLNRPAKLLIAHDLTQLLYGVKDDIISAPIGFQGFPLAEIEWKYSGEIVRWSDKASELFLWEEKEFKSNKLVLEHLIYKDDYELFLNTFERLTKEKQESFSLIIRNITKSGVVIYTEWYNSILYDKNGKIVSVYSLIANVTDRVISFRESEKSMRSYRDLFNSMSEAIYLLDHDNNILVANNGVKSTYGYEPDQIISKNQSFLRAPGKFDTEKMTRIWEIAEYQEAQKLEVWSKKANGEVFLSEMLVNQGSYFGQNVLIIIERDISDRKYTEEELAKRDKYFTELFNTTPLAIVMVNVHNEVETVNHGFEALFGYDLDEIYGLEIDKILAPLPDYDEALRMSNSMMVEFKQVKRIAKTGKLLDVIVYSIPILIEGKVQAKFGLYVDITEREKSEETIRTSLKEKELLLAEVHHRVKNNLAVISGLLELQSLSVDDLKVNRALKDSRLRIQSIALVHEKLYQNENLSEIEMDPYIHELVESLKNSFKSDLINIHFNFDIDPISLIITQAIPCGLLVNEIITNTYKHAFNDRKEGKVDITLRIEKGVITLSIKDDGVGLENLKHTSSKPSLGMKLIRTISRQLKSNMEIKSKDGTEFIFFFDKAYI